MKTKSRMKRIALGVVFSLVFIQIVFSQNAPRAILPEEVNLTAPENQIGFRAGVTSGFSYRHFYENSRVFEGVLGFWPGAFTITGLYEHVGLFKSGKSFSYYYGLGGHIALGTTTTYAITTENRVYFYRNRVNGFGLGVDGIFGVEYKFPAIPIAFSFDLKPFVEFNQAGGMYAIMDPGVTVRVFLGK